MPIITDLKRFRVNIVLGENIKRLRKEKGWSQAELAQMVGVHLNHINRIETNKTSTTIDLAVKLADVFEVSLDALVSISDQKPAEVKLEDQTFAEKIRLLNTLDEEDRRMIMRSIDNALTKQRMIAMVKDLA